MNIACIVMFNTIAVEDFIKDFSDNYSLVIEDGVITEVLRKE